MWWPFRPRRRADTFDAGVRAFRAFVGGALATAEETHALLDAWGFDPPQPVVLFLVRQAKLRRHKLLPEPEWAILLEDGEVLIEAKMERIAAAIVKLAQRLGVRLTEGGDQ